MSKYFIRLTNKEEGIIIELNAAKVESGLRSVYRVDIPAEFSVDPNHPDYTEYWHYQNHKEMTRWEMEWDSTTNQYIVAYDPEDYEIMELKEV